MFKTIFRAAVIIVLAVGSWLVVGAGVNWLGQYLQRSSVLLLIVAYLLVILVFGLVFGLYYRTPLDRFSAGITALIALGGLIAWQLIGPTTPTWSIAGWLIPTVLAGAVVYGRRELFAG